MSSKSQSTGRTDNEQPTPTAHKNTDSRRGFMRKIAVGAGTAAAVKGGAVRLDHGPVQEAEAIAPAVAAAGIGASAASGWVLRETEIIGSDDPPEGLTEGALRSSVYETMRTRRSTNASTFVDNQTIVDQADQAAYSEGKRKAFESIEEQKAESDVLDDAQEATREHITTIQKNLLKSWNESVLELRNIINKADEHPEVGWFDPFTSPDYDDTARYYDNTVQGPDIEEMEVRLDEHEYELASGEQFDIHSIYYGYYMEVAGRQGDTTSSNFSPINSGNYDVHNVRFNHPDRDALGYLDHDEWSAVLNDLENTLDEVLEGLETWVEGVYGDVQSGNIDTSQLLTARDRSEMTAEDEGFAQAQSDLQSLNISADLEREAEVYFTDLDTTLYGQLAYTGESEIETGEVDPDELDGVIYLTYDLAQGSGLWTEYEEGLDGGVLTLTQQPPSGYVFEIVTTNDETAMISTDDFEQNHDVDDEDNEYLWEADLSDQLDQTIVDFDLIVTTEQSTQYETTQLDEPFEIVTFRDSDGEEYDGASFESSEPHSDDNYISQEEWEESQERHEELIEKYEDAQNDGIAIPGAGDLLEGEANTFIGMVVVGAFFVVTVLSALNPLS